MNLAPLPYHMSGRLRAAGAVLSAALLVATPAWARLKILAAENVYGVVAASIAGSAADVSSVLSNPAQDPHEFEASAEVAREVASADIVVVNGVDFDPWMDRLLGASERPGREVIRIADLVGAHTGDNPHLWYAPGTMVSFAEALTAKLVAWDAADAPSFEQREKDFVGRMNEVNATIADMRKHFGGMKVAATEPVFGPMAAALGFSMQDGRFQLAVMNGTEPRAGDVAAIENDLRRRRVRMLFHNAQVTDAASERLIGIAQASHIAVVAISEFAPPGADYVPWIMSELAAVRRAAGPSQ
jgi:zinc/manganese transport system substrate-binding protein